MSKNHNTAKKNDSGQPPFVKRDPTASELNDLTEEEEIVNQVSSLI